MGRKLHYRPGSWYQTDDRTGFVQRVERTRKEWDGLLVDERVWEPRQPQDLVRGVVDNQNVSDARPLGPNVFVGPIYLTLSANVAVGALFLPLDSTAGVSNGDNISVILNSGIGFNTIVVGPPVNGGVFIMNPIPYPASAGNQVADLNPGRGIPVPTGSLDFESIFNIINLPLLVEML